MSERRRGENTPDFLWAFCANQFGPWFKTPKRMKREGDMWWDSTGAAYVNRVGISGHDGYVAFASESKKEVQLFMDGFNAARGIVALFAGSTRK